MIPSISFFLRVGHLPSSFSFDKLCGVKKKFSVITHRSRSHSLFSHIKLLHTHLQALNWASFMFASSSGDGLYLMPYLELIISNRVTIEDSLQTYSLASKILETWYCWMVGGKQRCVRWDKPAYHNVYLWCLVSHHQPSKKIRHPSIPPLICLNLSYTSDRDPSINVITIDTKISFWLIDTCLNLPHRSINQLITIDIKISFWLIDTYLPQLASHQTKIQ